MHRDLSIHYAAKADALNPTWWTRMSRRSNVIMVRTPAKTKIIVFITALLLAAVIGLGCGAGLALSAWIMRQG